MSPDYRSLARKFDELIKRQDIEGALKIGYSAVMDFDLEREYSNSINFIEKMINSIEEPTTISKLMAHLILRGLISGDTIKVKDYREKLQQYKVTPMANLVDEMLYQKEFSIENQFILDSIEKQTIFGKFEPIEDIPFIEFENEDAVYSLEDYFSYGRYIVNLIQLSSSFHHSLNIDIGESMDVNIFEKTRIVKLD
ncbi:MAG: hypothetical protein INQ03_16755 [Candidatus Heimdallarchaeota archaeon]|nr:hypothetical protein [Candidatus Heimdallarchaeota archaeon]